MNAVAADPRPRPATAPTGLTSPTAHRLTWALAAVTAAGCLPTAIDRGLLKGPAVMIGSARGTALVMLVVALPLLLGSALLAGRGHVRAVLPWLGAVAYLAYNAVMLLLGTPYNALFLCYVAIGSLSVWTAIALLHSLDVPAFAGRFGPQLPVRALAVYVWAIAGLNTLLWLKGAVPGLLAKGTPDFLVGTGLTTSPTYVQDLMFWLPLMFVGAWWLWHRQAWGFVVVGAMLVQWVVEAVGIAADQQLGHLADPASTVVAPALVPGFAVLAVLGLVPVWLFARQLPGRPTNR